METKYNSLGQRGQAMYNLSGQEAF